MSSDHHNVDFTTWEFNESAVVEISGEVDIATATQLENTISVLLLERTGNIAVDLDQVEFLDSTGLAILARAVRQLRAAEAPRTLVLHRPKAHIRKLLEITNLDNLLDVVEEAPVIPPEAVKAFDTKTRPD